LHRSEAPDVPGARILFTGGGTGGHLYPALNIAAAIRKLDASAECFFVGSRRGIEARVLPDTAYPHSLLPLEPIRRSKPWRNWRLLATTPSVLSGVASVFRTFRPHVVVGTGGYVSGAALAWARLKGVPIVLQEQNAEPGFVTRLMARGARQIHLGYPEARSRLSVGPGTRIHDTGNPVAGSRDGVTYEWPEGRVLLVVGGSQGALGINEALLDDLENVDPAAWPEDLTIVWIAGRAHAEALEQRVVRLGVADRIRVEPFIADLGRQLGHADLALSRSGAMVVAELCTAGVPSILVPLPTAAADHQTINATALSDAGAAVLRTQGELRCGDLWTTCLGLIEDAETLAAMGAAARARARPHAAENIAAAVLGLAREAT
jgi:UDP-N-acetylglucosamine--N-acetylmuramyl-(pentapeptide) pyrophosphoryl-undecaprenol N-acetylglucosamine transferase